jgi:hypothetical protein
VGGEARLAAQALESPRRSQALRSDVIAASTVLSPEMESFIGSAAPIALDDCAALPTLAVSEGNAGGTGGTGAGCRKKGCLLGRRLTVTKDKVAPEIAAGFASEVSVALERTIVGQREGDVAWWR